MKDLKAILESLDDNDKERIKSIIEQMFNAFIKTNNSDKKFYKKILKKNKAPETIASLWVLEVLYGKSMENIKTKYKELFGEEFVEPTFNEIDFED